MKIVFFGNTKFSLIGAKIIHQKLGISYVITLPDRPDKKGRLTPNPLKIFAKENNIPCILVDKITLEKINQIQKLNPDFLIVEDYGLILPPGLLKIPKYASLNIHHSLLPKYRGTSPAPYAILNGDKITGVTVIEMNDTVDAGDILAQKEYSMKPDETTESLLTVLNKLGGEIIIPVIESYLDGSAKPKKQNESNATLTKRMSKSDGQIDIKQLQDKDKLDRMIRAYFHWPNVWTRMNINEKEKIVKFLPGKKIQVEGGNPMSLKDFINGYPEMEEIIKNLF
ncbi:MAG TPA: methionyl-tRNA formyltransferase [Candidatus Limnocylindrales bacterium]|nr:methionyl-tRNA formyltransferase [Candidatus Limnocylindrales bacterium]